MEDPQGTGDRQVQVTHQGPGPFVTCCLRSHLEGGHLVAHSRRHRKGLRAHRVSPGGAAQRLLPLERRAFRHLWAPRRLGWWVAILFLAGSACFTFGALVAAWPETVAPALTDSSFLGRLFVVGAVFFTGAAGLQWLEVLNGDVQEALHPGAPGAWRWFGWRPRNLGYLACSAQLAGTLLFNLNTLAATRPHLSEQQERLWVWSPNMAGCICFLVASYLAYTEVSHGPVAFAPRSLSWWIAVVNLGGSAAFQASALTSFVGANEGLLFWSNVLTMVGGACFFAGAYLLIPELFDEEPSGQLDG